MHTAEKSKWRRKEKDLRIQILRLQQTVDKYKLELKKIQEDSLTADLSYIRKKTRRKVPYSIIFDGPNCEFQEEKTNMVRRDSATLHCSEAFVTTGLRAYVR